MNRLAEFGNKRWWSALGAGSRQVLVPRVIEEIHIGNVIIFYGSFVVALLRDRVGTNISPVYVLMKFTIIYHLQKHSLTPMFAFI